MNRFPPALQARLDVSRETLERLTIYEGLLRKWMPFKNLIAPSTVDQLWSRHFADSLQLVALAPSATRWLDLGSGAGFPGLVIACALAEKAEGSVDLVDSDHRKCAFLREAARELGVRARVHHDRIENVVPQIQADAVTARAVAELSTLLQLTTPLILAGALALFPKGREYAKEIASLDQDSRFMIDVVESITAPDAKVLAVRRAP